MSQFIKKEDLHEVKAELYAQLVSEAEFHEALSQFKKEVDEKLDQFVTKKELQEALGQLNNEFDEKLDKQSLPLSEVNDALKQQILSTRIYIEDAMKDEIRQWHDNFNDKFKDVNENLAKLNKEQQLLRKTFEKGFQQIRKEFKDITTKLNQIANPGPGQNNYQRRCSIM